MPGNKRSRMPRAHMAEAKAEIAAQIKRTASIIRTGNPVDEICHAADELDVSLIMIARYGKSDYAKNIPLGTVADGVVAKAQRPLFVLSPSYQPHGNRQGTYET